MVDRGPRWSSRTQRTPVVAIARDEYVVVAHDQIRIVGAFMGTLSEGASKGSIKMDDHNSRAIGACRWTVLRCIARRSGGVNSGG